MSTISQKEQSSYIGKWAKTLKLYLHAIATVWRTDKLFFGLSLLFYFTAAILPIAYNVLFSLFVANVSVSMGGGSAKGYFSSDIVPLYASMALYVFVAIMYLFYFYYDEKVQVLLKNSLHKMAARKAASLDFAVFDSPEFFDMLQLGWSASGDMYLHIIEALNAGFMGLVGLALNLSAIAILKNYMIVVVILFAIAQPVINGKITNLRNRARRCMAGLQRRTRYYIDAAMDKDIQREFRVYGLKHTYLEKYTQSWNLLKKQEKRNLLFERFLDLLSLLTTTLPRLAIMLILMMEVIRGKISVAEYVVIMALAERFIADMWETMGNASYMYELSEDSEFYSDFMDIPSQIIREDDAQKLRIDPDSPHTIEFRNVCFRYQEGSEYALDNVSFTLRTNEIVTIVGSNGAGKTTLVNLLAGIYKPVKGEIYIDGRNREEYSMRSIYGLFSILFQDYCTYRTSVEESVAFAQAGDIDRLRLAEALDLSESHKFLDAGDLGKLVTKEFDGNGLVFSGGQNQRLALARSYYKQGKACILDEPSASIDAESEDRIIRKIIGRRDNRLIVLISHRMYFCRFSNRIFVMKDGKLIEDGSHDQLMGCDSYYKQLFNIQAEQYRPEAVRFGRGGAGR